MASPKEQMKKSVAEANIKTIELSDGSKVTCNPAKGKHVRQAQRLMDGDETLLIFSLIAICADFNGKKVTIEELDEMPSQDIFALTAEYAGSF